MMMPPSHRVPGVVAPELFLVHQGGYAVWLGVIEAYPEGVLMRLQLRRRSTSPLEPGGGGGWRFGVRFSDGQSASAFGLAAFSSSRLRTSRTTFTARAPGDRAPAADPVIEPRAGGG